MSTSNCVFPSYQGESTIFDKGNFLYQTPDTKGVILPHPPLSRTKKRAQTKICCVKYNILLQSLVTSGMQACKQPSKGKRKESAMRDKEREVSTKGKEGLYKKTTNSYSPSKVAKEWREIPFILNLFLVVSSKFILFYCFLHSKRRQIDKKRKRERECVF